MVRDQDDIAIAFSLWEQARKELAEAENRLYDRRKANTDPKALDVLDAEIAVLRVRADRLLGQAIEALREQANKLSGGQRRPDRPGKKN
ncbi:RNA polymerase subunit sigma-32 [Ramlibacter tataouinensis]|uniref:RNA polymerase sigma-32 factor-like protein n=1 Tax=Ramlibacter tataouinensis (strain ATCC BAA-407 / DSM 14655 / LMG 21543 / TTB310) TaxID=365046 RepID=F5Y5E0_RAMTT|nr:RNA polymerase subunit sigma-32 [Ramlibacter tataouinensis]AEG91450.1 RNA polymerase sigma-32 factor-like protein [Ramlibacter tataouinensis TTB310]